MQILNTERGFRWLTHRPYLEKDMDHSRLLAESSAIGDYDDALDKPGSSYLWIGDYHHLNREEVVQLVAVMTHWLKAKRLPNEVLFGGGT